MMFDEALEAADVPQADRTAFRVDVRRAWLVVHSSLEVPTVRAVMRGLLTAEEVEAAQARSRVLRAELYGVHHRSLDTIR